MIDFLRKQIVEIIASFLAFRNTARCNRIRRRALARCDIADNFRKTVNDTGSDDGGLKLIPPSLPAVPGHATLKRIDADTMMLGKNLEGWELPGAVVSKDLLLNQYADLTSCAHKAMFTQQAPICKKEDWDDESDRKPFFLTNLPDRVHDAHPHNGDSQTNKPKGKTHSVQTAPPPHPIG